MLPFTLSMSAPSWAAAAPTASSTDRAIAGTRRLTGMALAPGAENGGEDRPSAGRVPDEAKPAPASKESHLSLVTHPSVASHAPLVEHPKSLILFITTGRDHHADP